MLQIRIHISTFQQREKQLKTSKSQLCSHLTHQVRAEADSCHPFLSHGVWVVSRLLMNEINGMRWKRSVFISLSAKRLPMIRAQISWEPAYFSHSASSFYLLSSWLSVCISSVYWVPYIFPIPFLQLDHSLFLPCFCLDDTPLFGVGIFCFLDSKWQKILQYLEQWCSQCGIWANGGIRGHFQEPQINF